MRGLSIIEMVVAVAVLAVIGVAIIVSFSTFRENRLLENAANESLSLIKEARSKTLSSEDFSQYGIHFETSKVILFKGTTFSASDPDNIEIAFSSLIEISSISLNGGGSDAVFQKLTGETNEFGSVIFRVKSDTSKAKTINIKSAGIIDVQ